MGEVSWLREPGEKSWQEEKVIIDNVPDLGDKTGEQFLNHLEEAIARCRELIKKGYRLAGFWSDPDQGIEFTLKKFMD